MTQRTMNAVWAEYMPDRVMGLKSEKELVRVYEKYIEPIYGNRVVSKLTFKQLNKQHKLMSATPYQANRVASLLKNLIDYAIALRWVPPLHNPARKLRMFPEKKRRRHMTSGEAPKIAREIEQCEETAPHACLFLWLLIYTGARPSEIKRAEWSDLIGNVLHLDKHKTDEDGSLRKIAIPEAGMKKIDQLATRGQPGQKIIPLARPEYIWYEKIRPNTGLLTLRPYDLRHTFGTHALALGYTLDQIGESLHHADPKTTKIYTELLDETRGKLAEDVGESIHSHMT